METMNAALHCHVIYAGRKQRASLSLEGALTNNNTPVDSSTQPELQLIYKENMHLFMHVSVHVKSCLQQDKDEYLSAFSSV